MSGKDRITTLERLIQKYQKSYYDGAAEIADAEFDLLWDELKTLDPANPLFAKVGADDTDGFPKAKHLIPMGSQEKAANPAEFRAWAVKMGLGSGDVDSAAGSGLAFIVQYKLDGASLELQYEKGKLVRAITRGDGSIGDEITANARRMAGVLPALSVPFSGGVRGEVVMSRAVWQEKYTDKANCRNAANGIMRRKDGAGCEDLNLIAYDAAAEGDDTYFKDEKQKIGWLKKQGFEVTVTKEFSDPEEVITYRAEVAAMREKLPVDIDGLVVKDPRTDMTDLRRARPERQIAFKFELETAFSILRSVEWSESGATYTPIGVVDPVRIAGTTVQRANLNNPQMIRSLGLMIGSAVCVVKRGEIIPKIEGLAPDGSLPAESLPAEKTEILFPKHCTSCNTELVDGGTRLYCPNPGCPKRLHHRLEKWVSVLDIRELGEKLILQLFDKGRIRQIADFYTLEAGELAEYERMGELSAAKVVRHIRTPRSLSLAAFVAGFDLEGVGETIMDKVSAAGFDTLEKLRSAPVEELAAVYGLGDITARTIVEGLTETAEEMDRVLAGGIISIAPPLPPDATPLRGKSFCFTGELVSMKRNEAEEKIKALGASAKSSVVKDLSYLVTNDPESGSGKNAKARKLGVTIISEEQFLSLLKDPGSVGKREELF
ncbi:NAD-dependent DNA ligase LigA [Treponema primitia]|uniref:NAD-dependent DNA ligase LigA n=1 Tax=Treponema primitia TaxID=88058 RepID=UPI000255576D|nr:NAD-dependent DNA ligase LigA [Treponema primitia]